MSFVPLLQQELDAISIKYSRHQIAFELNQHRHTLAMWRVRRERYLWYGKNIVKGYNEDGDPINMCIEDYDHMVESQWWVCDAMKNLVVHFPRMHRKCLLCGEWTFGDLCQRHYEADLVRGDYPQW
jgi:hypothetical protein